ncbi:hypothetical protein [Actinoplanes teichomyceticus]|uniref:Uncharacterized protein n=1 Tax=Actinoplanes teichomyceticus TaxID=1867 RepID=A0A561WLP3_ACTTI|nr:hypothetical protein [Actinoplanes teichomyceticus]TWG24781.1 hypothetical protein FHX34_1021342 [Actinoplanes teichomyceticus]GIF14557.1 hypothetical protein Ate01nite_45890 [Actinoplanes teichomyceticus]
MSDTTQDEVQAGLQAVLQSFVMVCGAPDDAAVCAQADDTLAKVDELLARAHD